MPNPCETIEEVGHLADAWVPAQRVILSDTAVVAEVWTPVRAAVLAETGTLSEEYRAVALRVLADTGTLAEAYMPGSQADETLDEQARCADTWQPARSAVLVDIATLSDALPVGRAATLSDTATVADTVLPYRSASAVWSDTGRVADQWGGWRGGTLQDSLTVQEAWQPQRSAVLADTGTLGEVWQALRRPSAQLVDAGTLSDVWSGTAHRLAVLSDEGLIDEHWLPPGDGTDAWTANTDTWAMSRYEGFGVNSVAELGGVLHGAGAAGVYRMTAGDDDGMPIAASVLTGLHDFGSEQVKRLRAMYVGARLDGLLAVDVRDVGYGTVSWHSFNFEARGGQDLAPQRALLARGMRSRYWQFRIKNVAGADFAMDSASVMLDQGSRRV